MKPTQATDNYGHRKMNRDEIGSEFMMNKRVCVCVWHAKKIENRYSGEYATQNDQMMM